MCFTIFSNKKNASLGNKNKKLNNSKNWHFSKGVNPWFCSKICHFANFFFRLYRPEKGVLWYSRTKKRISRQWKQEVQKLQKIDTFPMGLTHGFAEKLAIFPAFFFRKYRPGKCVFWYSRTKKRISRQ